MSGGRQTRKQVFFTKFCDKCYAGDKHRTVGRKEELNPTWEVRESFLEEVTPEPVLKIECK